MTNITKLRLGSMDSALLNRVFPAPKLAAYLRENKRLESFRLTSMTLTNDEIDLLVRSAATYGLQDLTISAHISDGRWKEILNLVKSLCLGSLHLQWDSRNTLQREGLIRILIADGRGHRLNRVFRGRQGVETLVASSDSVWMSGSKAVEVGLEMLLQWVV